jgi:hypothetical protein
MLAALPLAAGAVVLIAAPVDASGRHPRPTPPTTQAPTTPCVIPQYAGQLYWQVRFDNVNCDINYADAPVPNPTEGKIISVGSSSSGPFYPGGSVLPRGTIVWVNYESTPACTRCHW